MKTRAVRWLILAVAIIASPALDASAQDHLVPELGSLNDLGVDYAKSLRDVLLKDAAFHYRARVICLAFGEPAWVVTLTCDGDGPPAYFIEHAVLEGRGKIENCKVRRGKTPIDREAAEAIQRVWLRMLRAVRHPEVFRTGADGVTYHFSRFVPFGDEDPLAPAGRETGQIWSPDPASPSGRLALLGKTMRAYAITQGEKRADLRKRILKEVVGLESDLDRRRKPGERLP
jgi:hypothetical protein